MTVRLSHTETRYIEKITIKLIKRTAVAKFAAAARIRDTLTMIIDFARRFRANFAATFPEEGKSHQLSFRTHTRRTIIRPQIIVCHRKGTRHCRKLNKTTSARQKLNCTARKNRRRAFVQRVRVIAQLVWRKRKVFPFRSFRIPTCDIKKCRNGAS